MDIKKSASGFFDLAMAPFWQPKGGPVEHSFAHWRCLQLLDQIGLTLIRMRSEMDELKSLLSKKGFAEAHTSIAYSMLNLDEEVFFRMVVTIVDNVAAMTPLFVNPAGAERIASTPRLIKWLEDNGLDNELLTYLKNDLEWYRDIKKTKRNPLTHVGAFRYVSSEAAPEMLLGTATMNFEKANSKPVKEELNMTQFDENIRNVILKLLEYLDFWTAHFQPKKSVFKKYKPDYSSVSFSGLHGFAGFDAWIVPEIK
jgi:hypothetical protein